MLIEIHMIQNHSPANLNRDDLGAPKTCLFGGVTRARISSQCLKRSIRRSEQFLQAMEKDGGKRTRSLISEIARRASDGGTPSDATLKSINKVFKDGGVGISESGGDANSTDILFYVPDSAIDQMAEAVRSKDNDLAARFASILRETSHTPDIALSGRMTEFKAKDHFAKLDFTVEAALSAAHAISTHGVVNEIDYFVAADDFAMTSGAGHLGESVYNSACFYKHFCIDWDQLVKNLSGNDDLARITVKQFLYAAALSTPTGKQTSFAAFNPPDGILVEVKTDQCVPMSYANAFADPVPPTSQRGLIGESVARLGQHVQETTEGYGIPATRFWFSPGQRHALTCIAADKDSQDGKSKKQIEISVVGSEHELGSFDQLVERVMAEAGQAAGAAL